MTAMTAIFFIRVYLEKSAAKGSSFFLSDVENTGHRAVYSLLVRYTLPYPPFHPTSPQFTPSH
jgi:hypothetical protein